MMKFLIVLMLKALSVRMRSLGESLYSSREIVIAVSSAWLIVCLSGTRIQNRFDLKVRSIYFLNEKLSFFVVI